jgi:acetoin utilization protein AcuB
VTDIKVLPGGIDAAIRYMSFSRGKRPMMTAGSVMTVYPATVKRQATIAEAIDLMGELDVRHVPVVARGELAGMLSDRDLARLDLTAVLTRHGVDELKHVLATPVAQVMRSPVIAVWPQTQLRGVIKLLLEHKIGAIPVVHPDTNAVLGIVSYLDVLRAIGEWLDDE